jgi:hypothetical protein
MSLPETPHDLPYDLSVAILHDGMVDKHGKLVTTSLTLNDMQDLARSCRTFGARNLFVVHSSPYMRRLARTLVYHWEEGFGATYNPKRKDAMSYVELVADLDEAIAMIEVRRKIAPQLIATTARDGSDRISFADMHQKLLVNERPYLMLLGTGWGMGPELMARADYLLPPIKGPTAYNHLSVRSACAILLERLYRTAED